MKKSSFVLLVLAATALVGCGGGAKSSAAASSTAASSTAASSTMSQVNGVDFFQLEETDIGTSDTVASGKLSAFSTTNPLKISMCRYLWLYALCLAYQSDQIFMEFNCPILNW